MSVPQDKEVQINGKDFGLVLQLHTVQLQTRTYHDQFVNQMFSRCALIRKNTDRRTTDMSLYEIQAFITKLVTIRNPESEVGDLLVEHMKSLRLAWAIAYAAIQGRTVR